MTFTSLVLEAETFYPSTGDLTNNKLASILVDQMKEYKLLAPKTKYYEEISVLPGYPQAVFKIVENRVVNNTRVYVFSSIKIHGKTIVSYSSLKGQGESYDDVLIDAFDTKYKEAIEAFYHYVPSMVYGVPSGYYDTIRPVGIKELYIPTGPEVRSAVKPKLLLVLIGYSNGEEFRKPIYIYYFGFEANGVTFEGTYTRLSIVLSVVIDDMNTLYGDSSIQAGLVFYYSAHVVAPISASFPVTTVYGFLGILAALIISYIEFDEDYKFYVTLFILFVVQLFLYIVLNYVAGITLDVLYAAIGTLGPWFTVLFLLWIAPYLFASYDYYSSREEHILGSQASAILEGIIMAIIVISISVVMVFTKNIVDYLVAVSGPGGVYVLIVALILVDLYVGYATGKLWAVFTRYRAMYTAPTTYNRK